ncbi:MAG: sugar isomerase [Clostridia bacterium]|nr:sugar isomerase [Clostridia bacterium]
MSNSRTKNAMLNITFSIVLQLVIFVRGLILPRMIIPTYGSDVNGLISSISQFLTYISLLEAGVGSIFRTSLYKPLSKGNMEGVSGIINEQKRFYRKIGTVFAFYVIALCIFYPMIAKTNIAKPYIISLIFILSVSTFAEYFVSLPYSSLLSADQKIRISYIVSIIYTIVNIFVTLFWVSLKADIRFIYLSTCIIGLLRPLFYTLYVKKHYKLNKKATPDKSSLNQRWNGMVHHFAFYIHTNTDSAILTVFIGTAMVSVYNVYGAIVFGVGKIISSVSTGVAAGLGNLIETNNKEQINKTVDQFELIQGGLTTVLYTVTALLLIPFIRIYTAKMTDVNYIQPFFGYVLIVAEAIYCFRCIYSTVSTNANKYKETQLGAILECVINLVISLVLVIVFKIGIVGVAIGTVVGMLTRYVFEVMFLSKNVLQRPAMKAVKMVLVSAAVTIMSTVFCSFILNYNLVDSFYSWILYAVITTFMVGIIASILYFLFYKETIKLFISRLRGR